MVWSSKMMNLSIGQWHFVIPLCCSDSAMCVCLVNTKAVCHKIFDEAKQLLVPRMSYCLTLSMLRWCPDNREELPGPITGVTNTWKKIMFLRKIKPFDAVATNPCVYTKKSRSVRQNVFNPLGPRPAAALSLRSPMQREVTVSNDPGIKLQKSTINTKQTFQLI